MHATTTHIYISEKKGYYNVSVFWYRAAVKEKRLQLVKLRLVNGLIVL